MFCKAIKVIGIVGLMLVMSSTAFAEWETINKIEDSGEVGRYTFSPEVHAIGEDGFIYETADMQFSVSCTGNQVSTGILVNSPRFRDTGMEHGYKVIDTQIKWDNKTESRKLYQKPAFMKANLYFKEVHEINDKLKTSGTVKLTMKWIDGEQRYYELKLDGADAAISKILKKCRNDYE